PDLETLSTLAEKIAVATKSIPGTISAYPERTLGGLYLDIDINTAEASRYGMTRGDVQDLIQTAIGGMNVTTVVDGQARYPLNIRFPSELREDIPALKELLVTTPRGVQIPLGQVADFKVTPGAPMILRENAQQTARVFVSIDRSQR